MPATVPDCSPCYWPWDYSYWAERYVVVSHTVHLNYNYSHCIYLRELYFETVSAATNVMPIVKVKSSNVHLVLGMHTDIFRHVVKYSTRVPH